MGSIYLLESDFAKQFWAVKEKVNFMVLTDVDHSGFFHVEIISGIIGRNII